jgi:hypothetical protein
MSISIAVSSASAIPDLPTLKAVVADWLDRDDLDSRIPTYVQMAEAMFNRELRTPEMEKSTLLPASSEDVTLPTDYLAMRSIYIEGSPDRPLRGVAPTAIRQTFDGSTGTPVAYTLVSGGLRLEPPPADALQLQLDYFARIEGLTDAAPSNWMLEKHPDAYLYGSLFYAEQMLDNSTRAAQWKGLLDEVMARINRAANNDRYGAGPLVPNLQTQVRRARC